MNSLVHHFTPAQAANLALLVDLEARWENLRGDQAASHGTMSGRDDLKQIQKVYEAFHNHLVAYNKQYQPAHIPEVLINNASRLQAWCQRMAGVFRLVPGDSLPLSPVHCLEKACRCADRIADRIHQERFVRPAPPEDMSATIRSLESLRQWCEGLLLTA